MSDCCSGIFGYSSGLRVTHLFEQLLQRASSQRCGLRRTCSCASSTWIGRRRRARSLLRCAGDVNCDVGCGEDIRLSDGFSVGALFSACIIRGIYSLGLCLLGKRGNGLLHRRALTDLPSRRPSLSSLLRTHQCIRLLHMCGAGCSRAVRVCRSNGNSGAIIGGSNTTAVGLGRSCRNCLGRVVGPIRLAIPSGNIIIISSNGSAVNSNGSCIRISAKLSRRRRGR